MSLLDKLKKNSTISMTSVLEDSKFFNAKDAITLPVPMLNVAFSGDLDGGLVPGLTQFAGPSKHFKTGFTLLCVSAYMKKYPDSVCLFYDSEFGSPQSYFKSFDIDTSRVIHTPVMNIEELKFDLTNQIDKIDRGEKVVIVIDSIGNLASKKEADDALDQKSAADMTRAKQLKSLFRIVTPHLTVKDIPMIVINHTYKEIGLFPKDIVGGGTGSYYSADNIFILGRQQEKEGTEIVGYNFIINVEKSRYVKEKSKIPVEVTFQGGISKYGGLMDVAIQGGFAAKPKNGWYCQVDQETGELNSKNWRLKDTYCSEFWDPILKTDKFKQYIRSKYQLENPGMILADETNELEVEESAE